MASVAKKEESTSIVVAAAENPAIVLIDDGKRDDLFAHIRREIEAFDPDVSTAKGRDAIKSFAYKITRTKTAIDAAGKELNEEARAKINAVDAARRIARAQLEEMAETVRRPLTEWENAEKKRVEQCEATIREIVDAGTVTLDDTAQTVRERGARVWSMGFDADRFGDMLDRASQAKAHTVSLLKTALDRLTREEEERAELERLRAEAAEREAREQAEREREEAEDRARAEADAAEQRRIAAEKAEAERLAVAKEEAAEAARREAEAEAQRRIDEERAAREAAEREARRIAKEHALREQEAQAQRDREESERLAREADQKHRAKVKTAAKQALMTCGADEETAKKIVMAIIAGDVPRVRLEF